METIKRPLSVVIVGRAIVGLGLFLMYGTCVMILAPENKKEAYRQTRLKDSQHLSYEMVVAANATVGIFQIVAGVLALRKRRFSRPMVVLSMILFAFSYYLNSADFSLLLVIAVGLAVVASFLFRSDAETFFTSNRPIAPSPTGIIRNFFRATFATATVLILSVTLCFMAGTHFEEVTEEGFGRLLATWVVCLGPMVALAPRGYRRRDLGLCLLLIVSLSVFGLVYSFVAFWTDSSLKEPLRSELFERGFGQLGRALVVMIVFSIAGSLLFWSGSRFGNQDPPSDKSADSTGAIPLTPEQQRSPFAPPTVD